MSSHPTPLYTKPCPNCSSGQLSRNLCARCNGEGRVRAV